MKNILILLGLLFAVCSCDDYFHDSGLADGKHDCTMWEYLNTQPQDWDSTVLLIERAGLVDLFDGKDHEHPEITFFGVTDLSIEQFLLKTVDEEDEPLYARVDDIPVDLCREMLLSHVVPGKIMKEEFDYEVKGTLTGGTMVTTLSDEIRIRRGSRHRGGRSVYSRDGQRANGKCRLREYRNAKRCCTLVELHVSIYRIIK